MHGSIMLNKHLRHPMRQGRGGWRSMLLPGTEQGAEGSGVCCCSANTSAGSIHGPFPVVLHEAQFGRYSSFPMSSIKQLPASLYATDLTFLLSSSSPPYRSGRGAGWQHPGPAKPTPSLRLSPAGCRAGEPVPADRREIRVLASCLERCLLSLTTVPRPAPARQPGSLRLPGNLLDL